jgi:hypothetical protein
VLTAYRFGYDGTRHVMYGSGEGHVRELWSDDNGWHHNDLNVAADAPLVDFAPIAGYATPDTQHVDFIQIGHLHVYEPQWQRRRRPPDVLPVMSATG